MSNRSAVIWLNFLFKIPFHLIKIFQWRYHMHHDLTKHKSFASWYIKKCEWNIKVYTISRIIERLSSKLKLNTCTVFADQKTRIEKSNDDIKLYF